MVDKFPTAPGLFLRHKLKNNLSVSIIYTMIYHILIRANMQTHIVGLVNRQNKLLLYY